MALNVYFQDEVQHSLLAAVTFAVRIYLSNGGANVEYLKGIFGLAEAQALQYGIDWPGLVAQAKNSMGAQWVGLLDQATEDLHQIQPGTKLAALGQPLTG